MKIGAVCEQTGLSDRTVRFYTEEGLLSPSYTKNYLGRKTFDFSEEDVAMLKSIAVLRKYGFSIPEIKAILEDPAKSVEIIASLRQKKQETIRSEQELLDVLLMLEFDRPYTVPELAEALNTPKLEETDLPEEPDDGCFLTMCKSLFWLMCGPAALFTIFLTPFTIWDWTDTFLYVKFHPWFDEWLLRELGGIVPVFFAAAMFFLEMKCMRMPAVLRNILVIILCLEYTFIGNWCFLGSVFNSELGFYSETEDPADYMILGTMERDEMGGKLDLLFPDQIPEYALGSNGQPCLDSTRYYNFVDIQWDRRFELYAQWRLIPDDMDAEKIRIQDQLSGYSMTAGQLDGWTIWSFSHSDPIKRLQTSENYEEPWWGYSYLFVAFHEESGTVRYIASYSEAEQDTPVFSNLDWD